jgi:hypothetical protein
VDWAREGESRRELRRGLAPGLHSRRAPDPRCVSSESFPLVLDGANGGVPRSVHRCGWKELDESLQGFVGPERTEEGLFEGFAVAGERNGGGFAVSRLPDDDL